MAFGLLTLVQVGFERPVLRGLPGGTYVLSTRLAGAITEKPVPLIEKSAPAAISVRADLYSREGA